MLLKHYEIKNQLVSHHKFNEHQTAESFAARMAAGEVMALISDAGYARHLRPGLYVGAGLCGQGRNGAMSAGCHSLCAGTGILGFALRTLYLEGFLPQKKGRNTRLESLKEETRTMIFYESPYRVVKTLGRTVVETFGPERRCSACREISKLHEESVRGTLAEVLAHFTETEPRGEFVIVVEGCEPPKKQKQSKQKQNNSFD